MHVNIRVDVERAFTKDLMVRTGRYIVRQFRISPDDADEIIQRACVKALMNINSFRGDGAFGTWFTKIAIREALMVYRHSQSKLNSAKVSLTIHSEDDGDYVSDISDDGSCARAIEGKIVSDRQSDLVADLISSLPYTLQEAAIDHYLHDMTQKEMAVKYGVGINAVKARIFRARMRLKEAYQECVLV